MENIKFEITKQDIKEYLKQHKDDENIKYREAMFIKYISEQDIMTKEALEIMMNKYNFEDNRIDGLYFYDNYDIMRSIPFRTFNDYLDGINNLDISGICHILIPTIRYYNINLNTVTWYDLHDNLSIVGKNLNVSIDNANEVMKSTIDYYKICEKLEDTKLYITFKMGKNHCRKELQEYSYIYGEEPVKMIKKTIRERM